MNKFKDIFLHSGKKYIVIALVSFVIAVAIVLYRGYEYLISYCDATFISGFICICFGGFSLLNYFGAYDTFGYSVHYVREKTVSKKDDSKKYNDMHDYVEKQNLKRSKNKFNSIPYFVIGFFWIFISIILVIFY